MKKIIVYLFNFILINRHLLWLFNFIYEHSNRWFCFYFEYIANKPNFDFIWKIKIDNQKLLIPVKKEDKYSVFHLPLSYKRNDKPIRILENIINSFYKQKDFLFIDIGANYGLRSLYFMTKSRKCILFEPNDSLKPITERVINYNNIKNITLVNKALSDKNDKQKFYISQSTYLSSLDKKHAESDNVVLEKDVELIALDSYLLTEFNDQPVAYIKIDVEGHEKQVCMGALDTIKKFKPALLIEILDHNHAIIDFLKEEGYFCFGIDHFKSKLELIPSAKVEFYKNKIFDYLFIYDNNLLKEFNRFIKN